MRYGGSLGGERYFEQVHLKAFSILNEAVSY